jgi:hypothetical protein
MKHLEPSLETYVYSHCNMCKIPIYFYTIDVKHLQHTSETFETYACNMCFPAKYHIVAWTNGGSSLRSSTPVQRLMAVNGGRRCPGRGSVASEGITLGEHLCEATRAALGKHMHKEQLASTRGVLGEHPYRAASSQ